MSAGFAPRMLRRSEIRDPRAVSVPWRGRQTGNVRYLLLLPPFADESAGLLGQPCYEPDEEHAKAQVPNAKETHGPRLVNADRKRCGDACALSMQGVGHG